MMANLRKHDYTLDGSQWDLSTLSLTQDPVDDLKKNPKATKIDLSNNFLVTLSPSFTSLTHLIELDLSKNKLIELPEEFGELIKLQRLDLYGNRLSRLPLSFANLVRLRWLDLKQNPLDANLMKVAGDCINQKQCQSCAVNVVKFMGAERKRIIAENVEREARLKMQQQQEKKIQENKKIQKEKRKAKLARRAARKEQEKEQSNGLMDSLDSDGDKIEPNAIQATSNFCDFVTFALRFFLYFIIMSTFIFTGIAIGIHLQKGLKLESFTDVKIALQEAFYNLYNYNEFINDVGNLFIQIVTSLNNWRKTFIVINEKK